MQNRFLHKHWFRVMRLLVYCLVIIYLLCNKPNKKDIQAISAWQVWMGETDIFYWNIITISKLVSWFYLNNKIIINFEINYIVFWNNEFC
jgi:ubiquitin-protein ligase